MPGSVWFDVTEESSSVIYADGSLGNNMNGLSGVKGGRRACGLRIVANLSAEGGCRMTHPACMLVGF